MGKWLGTVAAVFALGIPAHAENIRTKALMEHCESNSEFLLGFCFGYLQGYLESETAFGLIVTLPKWYCLPPTEIMASIQRGFLKWARANPDKWHEPAIAGVVTAFKQTYPCK